MRKRVDLLAHLHRAEFRGIGAAGTASDHDADDEHAELAQYENAEHVDDVNIGAEFAEVKNALLCNDAADQEGDQQNNRHRAPADIVDVMDHCGETESFRPCHDAQQRQDYGAEHVYDVGKAVPDEDDAFAD